MMDWSNKPRRAPEALSRKADPFQVVCERIPVERTSDQDKVITRKDLSKDQVSALDAVLDLALSGNRVVKLGGYAGTGKSTLIPLISQALGDWPDTAFCSLTGKASNVLERKLGVAGLYDPAHCGTLHSMMYRPRLDEQGRITGWSRNQELMSWEGRLIHRVIIDESSMVGERILQDLMSYGVPIIAVGDPGQLPPIEDKSVIDKPDVILKKIHRQAENNPIIQLANVIRNEGDIPRSWKPSPQIQFTDKTRGVLPVIGDGFERLGMNFGIMVRRNKIRMAFNLMARSQETPEVGDIVICLKNNPPVYNGMRGLVDAIKPYKRHWYEASIRFPDDGLVVHSMISKHQFGTDRTIESKYDVGLGPTDDLGLQFDYGTAMTVHKSQGSAFEECVLIPERWSRDTEQDYAQWLYTGVTRAANKITIAR